MRKIIDNQKLDDGLPHSNMVNIFNEYQNMIEDFKFHVGSGFFFLDGFGELYNKIDKNKLNKGSDSYYNKWGTRAPILILMGKETNRTTKEALTDMENLLKYAFNTHSTKYYRFLEQLIKENLIKFKVFTDKRFHAKIYFFYDNRFIEDIYVGSANLTTAGLKNNIELTAPILADKIEKDNYELWYKNLWDRSTDDLDVLDIINSYKKHDYIYYEPKLFFRSLIKLLNKEYLFYDSNLSNDTLLVKFQSFDFYQVMNILEKYNGCILASSVGLGKSFVALETIRFFETNNKEALLIGPSNLVKGGIWEEYLEKYNLEVETIGFGDLQNPYFDVSLYKSYDLVVVDEAHNLRNKSIRRDNMIKLIENSPNAKYLFLTATPINTKMSDLTNLIDLFYDINKYKWLNSDLKLNYEKFKENVKKFENSMNESDKKLKEIFELQKVIEKELIVKSTRSMIEKYFKEDLLKLANTTKIPEPIVTKKEYNYTKEYHEFFEILPQFLEELNWEHGKFSTQDKKYDNDKNLIYLYKWLLYKRAESSIYSFYVSLKKLYEKTKYYLKYLKDVSRDLNEIHDKKLYEQIQNSREIFNIQDDKTKEKIIKNFHEDLKNISNLLSNLNKLIRADKKLKNDTKLDCLKKVLNDNKEKKCLIFTEYVDTLDYLFTNLENEFNITYIAGKKINDKSPMKHYEKNREINKFKVNEKQHIIATEVLSEGFNIPEADIVINYDLPYNPVRLIQRVGRATRINVPKQIKIINFTPEKSIDTELQLIKKLDLRINNIINMIGIDYSIWSDTKERIQNKKNIDDITKYEILEELKNRISEENPDDIYQRNINEESKLDLLIKNSIDTYNISKEDLPKQKPNKPFYTTLISSDNKFYGIYEFKKERYEVGIPDIYVQEPLNPIKRYNHNEFMRFSNSIKNEIRQNNYRRDEQSTTSRNDTHIMNNINYIKGKISQLNPILNTVLREKLFTKTSMKNIIEDINNQLSNDNFNIFKEGKQINEWKKEICKIIKEEKSDNDINVFSTWDKNLDLKNNIKAFIYYIQENSYE